MEVEDVPDCFSFHALTASIMLMPWDILSFRKRLYGLGFRFSLLTAFLPSVEIVACCFFIMSRWALTVFLKSFVSEVWLFSSELSRPLRRLMSATIDFGIPVDFGILQPCYDEKKSVPLGLN